MKSIDKLTQPSLVFVDGVISYLSTAAYLCCTEIQVDDYSIKKIFSPGKPSDMWLNQMYLEWRKFMLPLFLGTFPLLPPLSLYGKIFSKGSEHKCIYKYICVAIKKFVPF